MFASEVSILKVSDICLKNTLLFVHKQQQGKLPDMFNSYYMLNNNVHSYNTRNATKLHGGRAKQARGKNSIKIKGAKLFNSISEEVSKLNSTNKFKWEITKNVLSAYRNLFTKSNITYSITIKINQCYDKCNHVTNYIRSTHQFIDENVM